MSSRKTSPEGRDNGWSGGASGKSGVTSSENACSTSTVRKNWSVVSEKEHSYSCWYHHSPSEARSSSRNFAEILGHSRAVILMRSQGPSPVHSS